MAVLVAKATWSPPEHGRRAVAVAARVLAAHPFQALSQLFGGGEAEVADLVHGLDAGRASRAVGHHQGPYRFDVAVFGLACTLLLIVIQNTLPQVSPLCPVVTYKDFGQ
jgi:hypothetical protein